MDMALQQAGLAPSVSFLHASSGRYASLAADLQEPFRHLAERVTIMASRALKRSQFLPKEHGQYALQLEHRAARKVQEFVHRSLRTRVIAKNQHDPSSYLDHFLRQGRSLRRHLIDPSRPFEAFEHA